MPKRYKVTWSSGADPSEATVSFTLDKEDAADPSPADPRDEVVPTTRRKQFEAAAAKQGGSLTRSEIKQLLGVDLKMRH
jgi:hypothetical protein